MDHVVGGDRAARRHPDDDAVASSGKSEAHKFQADAESRKPPLRAVKPWHTAVLVVGTHRSGTSALTGALMRLGVAMPRTPMAANAANPRGYWESRPLMALHDRLLASAGSRWSDWKPFDPTWFSSSKAEEFSAQLMALLASEYGDAELFAVKDPRICRIVPFWLKVLDDAGISAAAIIPLRNPLEVALSLKHRNHMPITEGLLIWLRNVLEAERETRALRRSFVRYDQILRDWQEALEQVARDLDLSWPRRSSEAAGEMEDFLGAELRHHRRDDARLSAHPAAIEWATRAYEALEVLRTNEASRRVASMRVLDAIREEFDAASKVFGPLLRRYQNRQRIAERSAGAQLDAERQQLAEELKAQLERATALEAERQQLAEELKALTSDIGRMESALDEKQARIQGLADRLGGLRKEPQDGAAKRGLARWHHRWSPNLLSDLLLGRLTRRARRIDRTAKLIEASGLFSSHWYLAQYPDVKSSHMRPAVHYLLYGAAEGRDPHPLFDTDWYLARYPDVKAAGKNPLVHYLHHGNAEGRRPHPLFANTGDTLSLGAAGGAYPLRISGFHKAKASLNTNLPIVAYESHNLSWQGAQNSLFEIANGIALRGRMMPLVMARADGPLGQLYRTQGIGVVIHNFPQGGLPDAEAYERLLDRLARAYEELGVSCVHANTLRTFYAILGAQRAGVPSVWNIRESEDPDRYFDYLPKELRQRAYECFSIADKTVFVAESTRSVWKSRADAGSHTVVANGLDVRRLMGRVYGIDRTRVRCSLEIGDNDILILSVGTVVERKGQLDLVDALASLDSDLRQRLVLAIVGLGNNAYSNKVRERLDQLEAGGLRTRRVAETQSESESIQVAECYLAADLFVLNSRYESYPRVILEAMSFGLPIIATPCFGVTEQVVDGESAIYYHPGDIGSLARHISSLSRDTGRRHRIGSAASERLMALNSYDRMLDGYEDIYRVLLNR